MSYNPSTGGGTTVAARAKTAAGQSIPGGYTATVVNFGTVDFDTDSAITTGASWKFTAVTAGYYRVSAAIAYATATQDTYMQISKNGTVFATLSAWGMILAGSNTFHCGSTLVHLGVGDYIQIIALQNTGGSVALTSNNQFNYVDINLV